MSELMISGFLSSVAQSPNQVALEIGNNSWTYSQLHDTAGGIAQTIVDANESGSFVGLLSVRSIDTYTGILGTLLAGKGYLPLHTKFPAERIKSMLEAANCKTILVGRECMNHYQKLQEVLDGSYHIIFLNEVDSSTNKYVAPPISPEDWAYVLFTSGSQGVPKGVAVTHSNVATYINYMYSKYSFQSSDRFSQAFDTTFDPSILDIFCAWKAGATVCVVPEADLLAPAKFIKEKELTVWHSVPSIGLFLQKMRLLKPDAFPTLRHSFFSAEALKKPMVEAWQAAAPNGKITNLYGPTECTITVTEYTWDTESSSARCLNEGVPLGFTYPHVRNLILNEDGHEVEEGEFYIGGPQLTPGYLNNPEKQDYHFVELDECRYFRTGDLVKRDEDGCIHFLGRIDDQVKIRGFRVELQEIDKRIREAATACEVITLARKDEAGTVTELIAFVEGTAQSESELITYCKKYLPDYMIPARILFAETLPRNANGKIDKQALFELADA